MYKYLAISASLIFNPVLSNAIDIGNSALLIGSESPISVSTITEGKCYTYTTTTILTKPLDGEVGEQILIKAGVDKKCKWDKNNGWLLSNGANYYIGKWQNLLFIDNGTGPDMRQIMIFDINSHRQQFSDTYFEPLKIMGGNLQYWKPNLKIATKQNCDKFADAIKTGLTPQIQQLNIVNLNGGEFASSLQSNKLRCTLTQ